MPAVAVADRVAALRSRNPSKGRGCCGVAVPGVESGEGWRSRLGGLPRRLVETRAPPALPISHARWRLASISGSGPYSASTRHSLACMTQ